MRFGRWTLHWKLTLLLLLSDHAVEQKVCMFADPHFHRTHSPICFTFYRYAPDTGHFPQPWDDWIALYQLWRDQ